MTTFLTRRAALLAAATCAATLGLSVAAEAQTSIKRGYLNLIHAREAIARHAARAEDLDASRSARTSWQALTPDLTDARDDASNHTM